MGLLAAMCFDNVFSVVGDRLVRRYDDELLWIEPWGKDSLRVRATKMARMPDEDWALLPPGECRAQIRVGQEEASIQNGRHPGRLQRRGPAALRGGGRPAAVGGVHPATAGTSGPRIARP